MCYLFVRLEENLIKNRYLDIQCVESTRIRLKKSKKSGDPSNYINANYVSGYSNDKTYICAQGPVESTVNDHWRMIIQERVGVIIMTTK